MALNFSPAPQEQAYYEGLFAVADLQRQGSIGGAQAVQFFTRSKLPVEVLKNIWTVADQNPNNNSLDRRKFAIAVRLIQLAQNGVKGQGTQLDAPSGVVLRPVHFEGVSGVSVAMPPDAQTPTHQHAPTYPPQPPQQQHLSPQQQNHAGLPPLAPNPRPMGQPPSPQRPPLSPTGRSMTPTPGMSLALTSQDPYLLLPNEQSRYEGLFPQYAQPDGFVYGKEAVDLFNKSGLTQEMLRDIWNMVDSPVDNRLDKLEFAMAMHLIVCVSKKNLPFPRELPGSLKALKSQQQPLATQQQQSNTYQPRHQASPMTVPMSFQQQRQSTPVPFQQPPRSQPSPLTVPPSIPSPTLGSHPSTSLQQQHIPPMYSSSSPKPYQFEQPPVQSMSVNVGPPPIYQAPSNVESIDSHTAPISEPRTLQQSTMSISDAFEGLTSLAAREGYAVSLPEPPDSRSVPSFGQSSLPNMSSAYLPNPSEDDDDAEDVTLQTSSVVTSRTPPVEKPRTTKELASSYDMGDDQVELNKLKAVLQKLQAENISLKAQLGSMTEEERSIHKEMAATIAEISNLSGELTTLRAQVLAAKSRLLEASSELKNTKEKKSVLMDLISETRATKEAMDAANEGIQDAQEQLQHQQRAPAPDLGGMDLFAFDNEMGAPGLVPGSEAPQSFAMPAEVINQPQTFVASNQPEAGYYPALRHLHRDDDGVKEAPAREKQHTEEVFRHPAPIDANHPREVSAASAYSTTSFEQEGLMGGTATNLQSVRPSVSLDPSRYAPGSDEVKKVEDLKARAVDAEQTARDADETSRVLTAQADELRRLADEAEAVYREKLQSANEHKKPGFLGRGKKKDTKAVEVAQHDAQEKKKQFLAIQSQANDAQAVALQTKREAERLKQEAEQAELNVASLASLEQQPSNGGVTQSVGVSFGEENGYQARTDYGGYHHQDKPDPAHSSGRGFMGGAMGYQGGFAPNVMVRGGDDGLSIPSPEELKDVGEAYSNPFSL